MSEVIPVILCGGSGTRLWPASRERRPKQFLSLMGENSLLQDTVERALRVCGADPARVVTVTHDSFADDVSAQYAGIHAALSGHILKEPEARNTAAAVALAALYVAETFGTDALLWILPSDHHVGDEKNLAQAYRRALDPAREGYLVTFGIKAARPETGYGYIRLGAEMEEGGVYKAASFVEKPDIETARAYVDEGGYLWNSGMFLFTAEAVLEEFAVHAPDLLGQVQAGRHADAQSVPFDKAVMEKSTRVAVVPCDPLWSDIGGWGSLWEMLPKDGNGNVLAGDIAAHGTRNCFIRGEGRLVACAGVENLVVVETKDALLVADRRNGEALRDLVRLLKRDGRREISSIPLAAYPLADIPPLHYNPVPFRVGKNKMT